MASVTICSDFGAPKDKVYHHVHCFSSICHEVMGPDAKILVFWMLNFKQAFSLSSFTFIKRLFSSSLFSAIRVVSSAYLRLLILLPEVLILACASSSLAFRLMYWNWCFWTVVLENTLESPLDCKEIQPVLLKEISPEYSLEGVMLKLKLQYLATWCEELTHWKRPWYWERLKAGGEGDDRGWNG